MPQITIKTGITGTDGREEQLTEYICDHPGCPNPASHVLGVIPDIGACVVVCDEHRPKRERT